MLKTQKGILSKPIFVPRPPSPFAVIHIRVIFFQKTGCPCIKQHAVPMGCLQPAVPKHQLIRIVSREHIRHAMDLAHFTVFTVFFKSLHHNCSKYGAVWFLKSLGSSLWHSGPHELWSHFSYPLAQVYLPLCSLSPPLWCKRAVWPCRLLPQESCLHNCQPGSQLLAFPNPLTTRTSIHPPSKLLPLCTAFFQAHSQNNPKRGLSFL